MLRYGFYAFLLGFACLAQKVRADEPKAAHGMFLFGKEKTYLMAVSKFEEPFDYQAVFVVSADDSVREELTKQMDRYPDDQFTLEPAPISLKDLRSQIAFPAIVYRGDYRKEKERKALFEGQKKLFTVTEEVVEVRKFDPKAEAPKDYPYLLFGSKKEAYLAHYVTNSPDFLQLLTVDGAAAKPRPGRAEKITSPRELRADDKILDDRIVVKKQLFHEVIRRPAEKK